MFRRFQFCVLALLGGLIAALPASGQRLFGPDAPGILKKGTDAIKAVRQVSYDAEYALDGTHPELIRGATGTVTLRTKGAKGRNQLRVEGTFHYAEKEAPRHLTFSTDGNLAYQIQNDTKWFYHGAYNVLDELLYPGHVLVAKAFGNEAPFGYDTDPESAVYMGELTVADVECHVVQLTHSRLGGETHVYLGKEDYLPRRWDRTFQAGDNAVTTILVLSNLDTQPEIKKGMFHLRSPEGFTKEEYLGEPKLLEAGLAAPNWELKGADGKNVSLKSLRGKVVIMDFWATWCGPCKRSMPSVQKLHDHFKNKPVVIFGVSSFETGDAPGYMKSKGYTYPLLLKGDRVAEDYHITGIPTFYVIGPKGDIIFSRKGYNKGEEEELKEIIEQSLAEFGS